MALRAYEQQGVGERLKLAREARSVDLDQASVETRIQRRYLESLESDAPSDAYPGPVFARAFLREYARYLGLNPRPLLDAYRATHPERDWPFLGGPEPLERRPLWIRGLLGALLLTAAVIGTVVVARPDSRDAFTTPDISTSPPRTKGEREIEPRGEARSPIRVVVLRIRVVDAPCWISVSEGGEVVLRGTQDPGFVQTFRHPRALELVLGNADAVRMTLNGEPLRPVGAVGDVYGARLVERDGRVRVVPDV